MISNITLFSNDKISLKSITKQVASLSLADIMFVHETHNDRIDWTDWKKREDEESISSQQNKNQQSFSTSLYLKPLHLRLTS